MAVNPRSTADLNRMPVTAVDTGETIPARSVKCLGTSRNPRHLPGTTNRSGRLTLKTFTTLAFAAVAVFSLAAMPAMAQSNAAPSDPRITGTQGGTVTTPSGKKVQAPPRPAPGSKGSETN